MRTTKGQSHALTREPAKARESRKSRPGQSRRPLGGPDATPPGRGALACVILAAGKGTRMQSSQAKVLHEVAGLPLVAYPVRRARELGANPVVAVLGHQRTEVEAALVAGFGAGAVTVVEQTQQLGTGHAVQVGLAPLAEFDGTVLVLSGDVPLLTRASLAALVAASRSNGTLAMLTTVLDDPAGYGRVVRDARQRVRRIVEHKDASARERAIREINAGIYAAPAAFLRRATGALSAKNAQGEYYLTDIIAPAAASVGVTAIVVDATEVGGINDRRQLAAAEALLQARLVNAFAERVTFVDPSTVALEEDVVIEADAVIGRRVSLRGRTRIGAAARVGDGAILTDAVVAPGAVVPPYQVVLGKSRAL